MVIDTKGIRQRGDSTYLVDITVKGVRQTRTVKGTIDDAKLAKAEIVTSILAGGAGRIVGSKSSEPWTLKQAVDYTRTHIWRGTRSEVTARINSQMAIDYFGANTFLSEIRRQNLDAWVLHMRGQGLSDGTIKRKLATLSKVMSIAYECSALAVKPAMPKVKTLQGRIRTVSQAEFDRLVALFRQWDHAEYANTVILLRETGMRLGELTPLRWKDVDFDAGMIRVWVSKNDLPRSIPLTKLARDTLRDIEPSTNIDRPVFVFSKHQFRHAWDRARSLLGLAEDTQFVPHALRHTCATRLIQRGVGVAIAQKWLGHKTIQMTMRYTHIQDPDLLGARDILDAAM